MPLRSQTSCLPCSKATTSNLSGQEVRLTFCTPRTSTRGCIPYDFAPLKTDADLGLIPEAGPFGGAARHGARCSSASARSADRVLHLDSGDCFQGAPIFNLNLGEVEFSSSPACGLDAAVIGNHEFDAGALNFTEQARDYADLPAAGRQLRLGRLPRARQQPDRRSTPRRTPSRTCKGVRVGVIGMANISSLNSIVEGGNSLQATPLEQNEAARALRGAARAR